MPPGLSEDEIVEKRDLFVNCALKIMESEGSDALTLRKLATTAGVSRTTPYLYFKDKAALLDAMRIHGFNALSDACEQAIIGVEKHVKQMRVLGETYVTFAITRPALYRLLFMSGVDGDMSEPLRAATDRYNKITSAPMQKAYDAGIMALPPERLGPVLWAAIHGLLELRSAGLLGDDQAFEEVQRNLNSVLAKGFVKKAD
ncbi:MAG: hypothetical protein COA52_15285 [Hyphomicrobiales bacterium]|nr:MAG: hypothetical protein COA52_15285 [Hyphomicrobiales bacterium]